MAVEENEGTPLLRSKTNKKNEQKNIRNSWLFVAAFSAVLGNFIFGYAMVFPSAVIPQLQKDSDPSLHMDIHEISWFGSVFAIGAIVGGLSAMVMNDKIGRKHTIMISVIPSTAGFVMMVAARKVWLLLLGRLFTGIAGGITASSIPVYVSEISHPGVRGALGSCPQIMAVFGSLALYILGLFLPWRWLAVAGEVPVLIMLFLLCFMPNSPRYLITNSKRDEASKALLWLRGPQSNYISELHQIERSVNSQVKIQWSDLRSPFFYKPILISMCMRFLQQMTGITPILVYLQPIFEKTAISLEPKFDAAIVGFVRLFSVAIAAALMDKAGRKALLYISAFIMYLATITITIYTHKTPCNSVNITAEVPSAADAYGAVVGSGISSSTLIPLISIMFIIFGYAMGWGPITWLLMSEILPTAARGVASGLCVVVSWVTAFVLTQVFMHAVEAYGLFAPFLFFSVICVVNIIFTAKCVPETKGRTLEEIENYFRTGRTFTIAERSDRSSAPGPATTVSAPGPAASPSPVFDPGRLPDPVPDPVTQGGLPTPPLECRRVDERFADINVVDRVAHGGGGVMKWLALCCSLFSCFGQINFGYAIVFPSAVIPQVQEDDDPSLHMDTYTIFFAIGAIVGGLGAMVMNDKFGRKHSIMLSVIPSTLGFLMMAVAKEKRLLIVGRLLTGISAGISSSSVPIYLSEISHPDIRGLLGSFPQIMTVIGGLALYALGLVLPWRWLAIAGEVPGLLMLILLCFMPNSPRYLITKHKLDEAATALQWLRGPNSNYVSELNQIAYSINSQVRMNCSDIRNPFYYKPILISVFMRFLQQMTGIVPILIYLEPIFEKTAVSLEPKYDAAVVGFVRLITIMIVACLMDKAGRKSLLYISGYTAGWGPITWLLMSEILPMKVRGITSGLCVVVSYITAFTLTQVFMPAVVTYGLYAPFLFICVFCVVSIIFTAKCVPETKGRTLEEIENYFRTGRTFTIAES